MMEKYLWEFFSQLKVTKMQPSDGFAEFFRELQFSYRGEHDIFRKITDYKKKQGAYSG